MADRLFKKLGGGPLTSKAALIQLHLNKRTKDELDAYKRELGPLGTQNRAVMQAILQQVLSNRDDDNLTMRELIHKIEDQIQEHRQSVADIRNNGPFVEVEA